jgi:threonine/homoserine/homoserine lactone efflux protein
MSTSAVLLAVLATLLVGAISPGPSFLLVSRIAVVQSRSHGLAAALGMGLGGMVFASLASSGSQPC